MFLTGIISAAAALSDLAVSTAIPGVGGLVVKGAAMLGKTVTTTVTHAGGSSAISAIAGDTVHTAVNGAVLKHACDD